MKIIYLQWLWWKWETDSCLCHLPQPHNRFFPKLYSLHIENFFEITVVILCVYVTFSSLVQSSLLLTPLQGNLMGGHNANLHFLLSMNLILSYFFSLHFTEGHPLTSTASTQLQYILHVISLSSTLSTCSNYLSMLFHHLHHPSTHLFSLTRHSKHSHG